MRSALLHAWRILPSAILLAAGFAACKEEPREQINPQDLLEDHRYDVSVKASETISEGIVYEHLVLTRTGESIHVVTADLSKGVLVDACWADGLCPNPAPNATNNGKQLRETLSETLQRRLPEGVLAGLNGDYYVTKGGFTLSPHVEEGEPVFFGNPYELVREPDFRFGFTQFTDGSVSFGARSVNLSVSAAGRTVPVYSVNDTILGISPVAAAASRRYQEANIYTARLVENPFPSVRNKVGTKALFIVAKASAPLTVNTGYIPSTVLDVLDGRPIALAAPPYVTARDEWVLQLTGDSATALSGLRTGDPIDVSFEMAIGGAVKPVRTHIGGKSLILAAGKRGEGYNNPQTGKRVSLIGATEDGKTVKLIASEALLTFPDCYELAKKLGLYNAIRLDGGGSTELCLVRNGAVEITCASSDSDGNERSNMNYIHLRK